MMIVTKEHMYTVKEIAKAYRLSEQAIRSYIKQGKLEAIRIGDNWRIPESAWQKFLEEQNKK
jgi:excisionase family DNA binding protein